MNGEVRVGGKDKSAYINAVFFCLERFGKAKISGLAQRQGKVLEIAESISKVDDIEITAMNGITIDDIDGLEVVVERVRRDKNERSQR